METISPMGEEVFSELTPEDEQYPHGEAALEPVFAVGSGPPALTGEVVEPGAKQEPYEAGFIAVFEGVRGSGKTCQLARCGMYYLAAEKRRVFSNFPIGGYVLGKYYETDPVPEQLFVTFGREIPPGSILIIDELQEYFDRQDWSSLQARMGGSMFAQIRKLNITIVGAIQFFHYLNSRIAVQVDCLVRCEDLSLSPWGYDHKVGKGVESVCRYFDLCGIFAGTGKTARDPLHPHWITGEPYKTQVVYNKAFWEYFDSHKLTALGERFKRYYIQKQSIRVTQQMDGSLVDHARALRDCLVEVFNEEAGAGTQEIKASVLMEKVKGKGFNESFTAIGEALHRMGVDKVLRQYKTSKGYYYQVKPL